MIEVYAQLQRYVNITNRDVHGVVLLDKPIGLSSNFLLKKVKKLFCVSKAGYIGTLDPLATGMLPICFGMATKMAKCLLNSDKKYKVCAKLGESTDTFDANGVIIKSSFIKFSDNDLNQCLESFKGQSFQIPPMFSSIKYHGVPLYKYARKGLNIPRKARLIYIYELELVNRRDINFIELSIRCSKGTYIRSLINDIGECLGCGAHVVALRRLMVGRYNSSSMVNIETLESIFYDSLASDIEVFNKLDSFLIPITMVSKCLIS